MSMFSALGVSGSGMAMFRTMLDAISDNISNINTPRRTSEGAFQPRFVVAQALDYGGDRSQGGGGVGVSGVVFGGTPEGKMVNMPQHPLADANGMIRLPDTDLTLEMTNLLIAQRGYQANVTVAARARDTYKQALSIGNV